MAERQQWGSRLGFIMAAAGSAIGLGNIVFFGANAYRFGAGAFYLPYLVALILVGVPVMIVELGLGQRFQTSLPSALSKVGGRWGEYAGWFGVLNTFIITMYYCTIIAWAAGMWWSSVVGTLFEPSVAVPAFSIAVGEMENPAASFFHLVSTWVCVGLVVLVWLVSVGGLYWGTKSMEKISRWLIPFIWIVMILFVIRGLTLDGGIHGAYLLFRPEFEVMSSPKVWGGAFAQIFFTLGLGFGIMTAFASYLPKKSDHTANALAISTMNCSFELIAGIAVFTLLFAFALTPQASTLGMMFFIIPKAIAQLPVGTQLVGAGFFTLLLAAGVTSSVAMMEASLAPLIDKFKLPRRGALLAFALVGVAGSASFALPIVVDYALNDNGTFGLSLLDLVDHYAFTYGLLIVGLAECLIVGWMLPISDLREELNEGSRIKLGRWFDVLIRYVIPLVLLSIVTWSLVEDLGLFGVGPDGFQYYGNDVHFDRATWLPFAAPLVWLLGTFGVGAVLTFIRGGGKGGDTTSEPEGHVDASLEATQ